MRFRGKIDEVRVYAIDFELEKLASILPLPENVAELARLPSAGMEPGPRQNKLFSYFVSLQSSAQERAAYDRQQAAQSTVRMYHRQLPTVMVMEELSQARDAHVLLRGQYDHPGEKVERAVPASLSLELPKDAPRNRLGLAKWLVDPAHPLTARVAVNRFWQMYFGAGLVKTAEDFGSQGEWPTHPELLDWLAATFVEQGWSFKKMHRMMLLSNTYQMSTAYNAKAALADPENRLHWRRNRLRLEAEPFSMRISGQLTDVTAGGHPWAESFDHSLAFGCVAGIDQHGFPGR